MTNVWSTDHTSRIEAYRSFFRENTGELIRPVSESHVCRIIDICSLFPAYGSREVEGDLTWFN